MSTAQYKNIPNLQVADYVCRNDGNACALLSGTLLVFELDASLVKPDPLARLTYYLRVSGMSTVFIIAWGYDARGNYKPGYYNIVQLVTGVGTHYNMLSIPLPPNVAEGDTWYLAVHMGPWNKPLLKAVLETL